MSDTVVENPAIAPNDPDDPFSYENLPTRVRELHVMLSEVHAFCGKVDELLAKGERALPLFLAAMDPDTARAIIGA